MIEVTVDFCDMIITIAGKKESFNNYGIYQNFGYGNIEPVNMDEFQDWGLVEYIEDKLGTDDFEIDYKYNYIREFSKR